MGETGCYATAGNFESIGAKMRRLEAELRTARGFTDGLETERNLFRYRSKKFEDERDRQSALALQFQERLHNLESRFRASEALLEDSQGENIDLRSAIKAISVLL